MPIILPTDRKAISTKLLIACIYGLLSLGGLTMVYPFLITLSSSLSSKFDYSRFSPLPRSLYSRTDRYVRGLDNFFKDSIPDMWFRNRPAHWTTWIATGNDPEGIDVFADEHLVVADDPAALRRCSLMAADYADFALDYDIRNSFCFYDFRDLAGYLRDTYTRKLLAANPEAGRLSRRNRAAAALECLNEEWGIPYTTFFDISLSSEVSYPMQHASWDYPVAAKTDAFLAFKDAYRRMVFRPGAAAQWKRFLKEKGHTGDVPWPVTRDDPETWRLFKAFVGQISPASQTRPFTLKDDSIKYLGRRKVKESLGLEVRGPFSVSDYNRVFGAACDSLFDIPFPVPDGAPPLLKQTWESYVRRYYPRRLMEIRVTPEIAEQYRAVIRGTYRSVDDYNLMMGASHGDFGEISPEPRGSGKLWQNFTASLPLADLTLHSAEAAYQDYLLSRYDDLDTINEAYGWRLGRIEEAQLPFAEAYTITFLNNEWRYYLYDIQSSYRQVFEFLFIRGRAFLNTVILCVLTILATLTVNPLAAYALSRFNLKMKEQILLFLLATMAFPTAVRAIPGFLLMRDLHLLNTFAALVLPSLANGMSIFILKGFFDSLPRELYEAATIDGAGEFRIFLTITLPMTKPILAVNTLNAFIHAYTGWSWAILVCQDKDYWTLAVWLYQMSMSWNRYPYVIMAGFVIASIPTAIVFLSCQKIIMRGIVIPSMK